MAISVVNTVLYSLYYHINELGLLFIMIYFTKLGEIF